MGNINPGAEFLQRKYKLNTDPGVVATAKRENIPEHNYPVRIQSYLDRLSHGVEVDKHGVLKYKLYDKTIIKPEEVPESYFQSIIQRHQDEGRSIESIPEEIKKDLTDTLIKDQRESLDIWIDYLSSSDAKYPDWFKYYVLRNVLVMGRYDKEKKKFLERSKTGKSVSQFPELIRDALSFVCDAVVAKQMGTSANLKYGYGIKPEEKAEFEELLKAGDPNFSRLYAWAIDKITPISEELLQQVRGKWVKYPQGSSAKKVVDALARYGTGWCIRGEGTAEKYLEASDLEIYFSLDQSGKPVVPRIVIVTRDGKIDEVRGVAQQEHWDPYITDVVEKKLAELPDGRKFKKRVEDMQKMTAIHHRSFFVDKKTGVKIYLNPNLTNEELMFLYEIRGKIDGFGYSIPDPRIKEILSKRNSENDMPIVFSCDPEQIAHDASEIRPDTKAYVGKLTPGIFNMLPKQIEHIYTSFPEGKITRESVVAGGKSGKEYEEILDQKGFKKSRYAQQVLEKPEFMTLEHPEKIDLVRLKVGDLGFTKNPTTDEIYRQAQALGLELCPPEVGPELRLKYENQPLYEWLYVGMKPIAASDGHPHVFELYRDEDEAWLYDYWARPDFRWFLGFEIVFRLRK